jgi:uroporphyrinogen III methyltransferase / synthase
VGEDSSKPLQGRRVVVTRALEQSEPLVKALREQGATAVVLPMVAFAPPDDVEALDDVLRGSAHFDWLLLTSQNALRALQERCEKLGIELAHRMRGVRVGVVGPATAEAARAARLSVEHEASSRYGTALAEELTEKISGKQILLPRSDKANPELVAKLESLGAQVTEIVAYKTVRPQGEGSEATEKAVTEGVDAVLFFSPSAVGHFQDILGEEQFRTLSRHALFTAIGPVTEKALRTAKVERVVMARDVTVDAVIAALSDHLSAKGQKLPAGAKSE